ncbi:MAG: GIY-YIG nuclease family protein [Candidatus Levybacteria bacterium]|nr:GIY-YIG nuclease family protein [Candidatus Levybacteria bacterium]
MSYSSDLRSRFTSHNNGENKATKPFAPYKLIFYEAFISKSDAKNREEYLKSGYGRKTINGMLRTYLNMHSERKRYS